MLIGKDKDGFSVYLSSGEAEKIAIDIIERCEVGCVSITVVDDADTLKNVLWDDLRRAAVRKDADLCDDILGAIRHINGEEMISDESV